MLSALPLRHLARKLRLLPTRPLRETAVRTWQIHPAEETPRPKATFLPGQLERILKLSEFSATRDEEERLLCGRATAVHAATRGYLLEDAVVLDGAILAQNGVDTVQAPSRRIPDVWIQESYAHGALYSTYGGNHYFGQWLIDDLVTYRLAVQAGPPVCTRRPLSPHAQAYEQLLEIRPLRAASCHFRELVVFDDYGQNRDKRARFDENRRALLSKTKVGRHPGVFLLRRSSGARRVLLNEEEVAAHLERHRGFRVLDTMTTEVPTLLEASAGAEVVAGVEGSHLMHALLVLEPGRSLLTIQHPNRFCSLPKDLTDRDGQHFGFVVGHPEGVDFRIDPDEVERTLDLLPR
jgi:hypothetical protein